MPVEKETGKTRGYCFIEYNTPQDAELAKAKINGYKLDKAHTLSVNTFDEIEKFMGVQMNGLHLNPNHTYQGKIYNIGLLMKKVEINFLFMLNQKQRFFGMMQDNSKLIQFTKILQKALCNGLL